MVLYEPLLIFSRQVVASGYGRKRSTLPWCQVLWESSTLGQCHSCGSTSSAFLRGSRWKQIKKRNKSESSLHAICMVKFGIPYDGMVLHTMRNKYNKDRINTYIIVRELAYTTQALPYVRGKPAYLFSHNSISSEHLIASIYVVNK